MTKQPGTRFFELGAHWRKLWQQGKTILQISQEEKHHPLIIRRAIWLSKWPEDLKTRAMAYPNIFKRELLVNGFAAKRKYFEQNKWKALKKEIESLIEKGPGAKPKSSSKPKKRVTRTQYSPKKHETISPQFLLKALETEHQLKQALGLPCKVSFQIDSSGEVTLRFSNEKDLQYILELICH